MLRPISSLNSIGAMDSTLAMRLGRAFRSPLRGYANPVGLSLWLLLVGSLLALPAPGHTQAMETDPDNVFRSYQTLAKTLGQKMGACRHKVHLIIALDTSGGMQKNNRLRAFYDIWERLLEGFFQPGDTFTLLPYHNRLLATSTKEFPENKDLSELKKWPATKEFEQPEGEKGNLLYVAQQEALKLAQGSMKSSERRVLVMMVTDGREPEDSMLSATEKQAEKTAEQKVKQILEADFRNSVRAGAPGLWEQSKLDISSKGNKIDLYLAVGKNFGSVGETNVSREIKAVREEAPKPQPPLQPEDNRSVYRAWAALCLFAGLGCLGLLKFRVTVKPPNEIGSTGQTDNKTVSAWKGVTVWACGRAGADYEYTNADLWLHLPGAPQQEPTPLFKIKGSNPSHCQIERINGVLKKDKTGGSSQEITIKYGEGERISTGLTENQMVEVTILPDTWMEGKTAGIMLCALLLLASLLLFALGMQAPPEPVYSSPSPPAKEMEDVCGATAEKSASRCLPLQGVLSATQGRFYLPTNRS